VRNDPPVVRAGIMAAVVLVGVLLYKDVDLINVVSFSGLAILLFSPLFLFDLGFQLSFASVFAILLLYPRLSKLISRYVGKSHKTLWKWIMVPALISVSVELVLFPILAYYFNMIPLVIVVANIFIVPLAGLSVVLACFTLLSATFSSFIAGAFSACNWLCLELTLNLTEFFANLPVAKLSVPAPSVSVFVLYYFFLWLAASFIASKKKALLFSVLIIANLLVWRDGLTHGNKPLKVTFLDVSQGSSSLIDLPNEKTFLINAGEKWKNLDAGEYVVIPFLNYKGATRIDKLILTDTDTLSLNSAKSILREAEVKEILLSNSLLFEDDDWESVIDKTGEGCQFLESVKAIKDHKGSVEIRFFEYPKTMGLERTSANVLTKIRYKSIIFCLFDGMKRVYFEPQFDWDEFEGCSVLVLSELGEADEIAQVIAAVKPQKIIFTRHYFRYEKDKIPTLMSTEFSDIEYYRTAEGGAITCETGGEKIEIQTTVHSRR
jgi:competence protein ComEC